MLYRGIGSNLCRQFLDELLGSLPDALARRLWFGTKPELVPIILKIIFKAACDVLPVDSHEVSVHNFSCVKFIKEESEYQPVAGLRAALIYPSEHFLKLPGMGTAPVHVTVTRLWLSLSQLQ